MFALGWFATLAWADPSCDFDKHFQFALSAYIAGEYADAEEALERARAAYACGEVANRQSLARFWLVDGALALQQGDATSAEDSLAAARALAPDLWLPNLPNEVRQLWSRSEVPAGRGALVLEPPPGVRPVWVDGASIVGPAEVPAGSHLVQIGDGAGRVAFADTVWVGPSLSVQVETGLPPLDGTAVVEATGPRPDQGDAEATSAIGFTAHLLGGVGVALGDAVASGDVAEPANKVSIPGEIGIGLRTGPVTTRLQVGTAWLTDGAYLGSSELDDDVVTRVRRDIGVGVVVGDRINGGAMVGIQWPGRIAVRGLVGVVPVGPLVIELRPGLNAVAQRQIEPAFEGMVGVRLK